jgi:nucleoside 2-deoxyribosyltransferase
MKIFIGQAVTGENLDILKEECFKIQNIISESGNESYCTINPKKELNEKTAKEWLIHAFEEIDKRDTFLAIIRSEKRSEGLLIEIGYALSKKKRLIVVIKKDIRDKTYIDELADYVIEFENIEELNKKLKDIK